MYYIPIKRKAKKPSPTLLHQTYTKPYNIYSSLASGFAVQYRNKVEKYKNAATIQSINVIGNTPWPNRPLLIAPASLPVNTCELVRASL